MRVFLELPVDPANAAELVVITEMEYYQYQCTTQSQHA